MMPRRIGPYELRAEIGQGGMATVYLAYQESTDRDVAIKVIRQDNKDATLVQRFEREARLIAKLVHPHILPLYDYAAKHQPPYIVMPYVDGGTLKDVLAKGTLTFAQIGSLLRQIASALDFAHTQGIIHRDIKPSNILLDKHGNALLSDFGIARVISQSAPSTELTQAGAAIGTPGYMAPEQSTGTDVPTPQADIYSLGVIFFEMITGQLPYRAESSIALILKHVNDPIPVATTLNPHLPAAVDALIKRVMAKDPAKRFPSATNFAEAVIRVLDDRSRLRIKLPASAEPMAETYETRVTTVSKPSKTKSKQMRRAALRLSISLLGSVQIMLNEQPVMGIETNTRARALLVYLAMEGDRSHRRETLADLLWPEKDGRTNLRTELPRLRRAINDEQADPSFLLIHRDTLQFNRDSEFRLDTDEFTAIINFCSRHQHASMETCSDCIQRLEEAAELYRGTFAQDITLPENEEFEGWLTHHREAFEAQVLDALYKVAYYHERRGAYDLAQRSAWRQIELQPWREEAYRQLMRLLVLAGQRTAAMRQYEVCCRVLEAELGVEPSPETVALYEHIKANEIKPAPPHAAAIVRRTILPTAVTSFVGRQKELSQLLHYLADPNCRLVTIIGLGGMGKTRLALEATRQAEALFPDVHFVSLAALEHATLIPSAIASAVQFSTSNQENFAAQLINYLSDKKLLLTLDNLDQFADGLQLLAEIVANAAGVKLLVTSREKLALQGEWVLPLKGLPVINTANERGTVESAVQLFEQRTRMVRPDFVVSPQELPDIVRICQFVDGMPLGIELASAWMEMLSCREIAESIASNLSFLTSTAKDRPERHQSLRGVFETSWRLLSLEQQRVLMTLSVFRGGFQADAALEVGGAALSTLLALVGKSMLNRDPRGRYQIHELLRQYALEKLQASGELEPVMTRHLQFFMNFTEAAELQIQGGHQILWLERLEAENDNLRTALEWSLKSMTPVSGLRLAASLWFFWHVRNYFLEGLDWLYRLIAAVPDAPIAVRAKALFATGSLEHSNRNLNQARALSQASLELAQQLGDSRSIAYPLSNLAWLSYFQGDYEKARKLGEESLVLFREVNDPWGIVHTLNILGYIAESQADYTRAEALQREGIAVSRAAGDNENLGWSLYLLGRVLVERGQYEEATLLCKQSLEIYRELGNRRGIAVVLYTLAESAMELGDLTKAATRAEESIDLLRELSDYWVIGGPLACLGMVAYRQGDLASANRLSQESLQYFERFGDTRGMAYTLNTLGRVAYQHGQYVHARDLLKRSLTLRGASGIRRGIETCFELLAEIAVNQKALEQAATLLGAADIVRETLHAVRPDADDPRYLQAVDTLRQTLSESDFNAAWTRGRTLALTEAIAYALNSGNMPK